MDAAATGGGAANWQASGVWDATSLDEITPEALGETFPKFGTFYLSGAWWSMRDGVETFTGPQSLIQLVLVARDADLTALAEKLCLQEYLDGLDPEELAAVYRDMLLPEAVR